jgi:hypothetical protein
MASIVKWRTLVAIGLFAEVFTLAAVFGLPALAGWALPLPAFPPPNRVSPNPALVTRIADILNGRSQGNHVFKPSEQSRAKP